MKKYLGILVIAFLTLAAGTVFAQDEWYGPFDKDYSISLSAGRTYLADSDFKKFWELEDTYDGFALSAERKFNRTYAIEATLGTLHYHDRVHGIFSFDDSVEADIKGTYLSLSPKLYWNVGDITVLYAGAGPDYYNVDIDLEYHTFSSSSGFSDNFKVLGLHAFAGAEIIFFRKQELTGELDAPVSLFVEYRFSRVEIEEADKEFIDEINTLVGTSDDSHMFDLGGNAGYLGIRWRF